jgi:hypothetical protein
MDEPEVQRPASVPAEGVIAPFDAGWEAHAAGLERETVSVLAADRSWALLGWDCRALSSARSKSRLDST